MPKKVREVIKELSDDGWVQTGQESSHRQLEHPTKPGKVTVLGHLGSDMPNGTYNSAKKV